MLAGPAEPQSRESRHLRQQNTKDRCFFVGENVGWSGICLHFSLGQWLQPSSFQLWFLGHSYNESPPEGLLLGLLRPSHIALRGSAFPWLAMLPSVEHPLWLNSNLLCLEGDAEHKTFLCINIITSNHTHKQAVCAPWCLAPLVFFLLGSFPASQWSGPGVGKGHIGQSSCLHSGCCHVWQKPQDFQSVSEFS